MLKALGSICSGCRIRKGGKGGTEGERKGRGRERRRGKERKKERYGRLAVWAGYVSH